MNQENDEKPVRPFVKSVLEFQSRLKFYEKIIFYSILGNILFGISLGSFIFSDPLVFMERDAEKLSFTSKRKEVVITEKEIKKLVENFVRRRYEWDKFSLETVMENLSPLLSGGLKQKDSLN